MADQAAVAAHDLVFIRELAEQETRPLFLLAKEVMAEMGCNSHLIRPAVVVVARRQPEQPQLQILAAMVALEPLQAFLDRL